MSRSAGPVLDRRTLNRSTLARQHLLARMSIPVLSAIQHHVALNAQDPNPPYLALWARIAGFERDSLTELLNKRKVVRSSLLRGTQHLAAASDYRWLRSLMRPVLARSQQGAFGRVTAGIDLDDLASAGRALLTGKQLTRPQLAKQLSARWPDRDAMALAWSVQSLLPLVHPPPNGTWNKGGATLLNLAEEWLGNSMIEDASPKEMIRRYLTAFGPAGVMDIQAWSGLTKLRLIVEDMRSDLRTYRDESGTELFDIEDGPIVDSETPAPSRLLPYFDNLVLAHSDRTRVMSADVRRRVCVGSSVSPTILIDGFVAGTWEIKRDAEAAVLTIRPFHSVSPRELEELSSEADELLGWAIPDAETRDVCFDESQRFDK
jgi:hypothetical protein